MKNVNDVKNSVNVTDVPCNACIRCKNLFGLYGAGYCTRLCMDCDSARNICIKTQWYAEMCTMNALLDREL